MHHSPHPSVSLTRSSLRWLSLLSALIVGSSALPTYSADGTFTSTAGGNWSNPALWLDGNVASGSASTAILQGTNGGTITLDVPVLIGSLKLNGFTSGNKWILSGGNITFDSGIPGAKSLIDLGNADSSTSTQRLEMAATISGSNGLEVRGGTLHLSNTANTFTGGLDLAGRLLLGGAGSLNGNTVRMLGGVSAITTGTAAETYSSNIILAGTESQILGRSTGTITLSGNINEEGGPRDLVLAQVGIALSTFRLTGNNTYTGNTTIGRASNDTYRTVVIAQSNTAFGSGGTVSFAALPAKTSAGDSVWLEGRVTISNTKLILRGGGYENGGSLRNRSGNNEWAGEIDLGTFQSPRIGVDAGTTLLISGNISGSATGGLIKVGTGTLHLSGNNTHTTGTAVNAGTLIAAHRNALGGTDANVTLNGASRLEIAAGNQVEIHNLAISDLAELAFHLDSPNEPYLALSGSLSGADQLRVSVDGAFAQPGTYVLLTITGTSSVADFVLIPGSQISEGSTLFWDDASRSLTFTVIPEPGAAVLLGMACLLGGAITLRRRKTAAA